MVMVVVIVIVAVIGIGIVFWLPLWCLTWTQVRAPTPCRSHVLNCVHHGFMIAQCLTRTKFIRWDLKRFTYSLFCSRDLLTRFGGRFVTLFKEFPSGLGVPPPPPGHWGIVHWHMRRADLSTWSMKANIFDQIVPISFDTSCRLLFGYLEERNYQPR